MIARAPIPRIRRKPKSQRHFKTPRCVVRGCVRRQIVLTFCRTHARLAADRKLSAEVRESGCEAAWVSACSGPIQCAHGFSRRYLATRWLRLNVFALCAGHHFYFTVRPIEWDDFIRERWGSDAYDELRRLALRSDGPPDYAAVLTELGVA